MLCAALSTSWSRLLMISLLLFSIFIRIIWSKCHFGPSKFMDTTSDDLVFTWYSIMKKSLNAGVRAPPPPLSTAFYFSINHWWFCSQNMVTSHQILWSIEWKMKLSLWCKVLFLKYSIIIFTEDSKATSSYDRK